MLNGKKRKKRMTVDELNDVITVKETAEFPRGHHENDFRPRQQRTDQVLQNRGGKRLILKQDILEMIGYFEELAAELSALSGIYFENYVSAELSARRIGLFYWKGKRDSEFEFIFDVQGRIIPLDVKKRTGSLNSLAEFRTSNKTDLAIKISANQ